MFIKFLIFNGRQWWHMSTGRLLQQMHHLFLTGNTVLMQDMSLSADTYGHKVSLKYAGPDSGVH